MKKLFLIRHAEAEPIAEGLTDFDRPLTPSGKQDAAQMAALLLSKGTVPQFIITSPALRALTTAHIFRVTLGLKDAQANPDIYEANADILLEIVNQLDNQCQIVALVGHNPGVSNLLYYLTDKITTMPTCGWAELELEAETWAEVSGNTGKILQYQYP